MIRYSWLLFFLVLIILFSCNPKVSSSILSKYETLGFKEEVVVYGQNDKIPEDLEMLGMVKVGETGFTTNCSYQYVVLLAQLEARKVGGNAIKISKHKAPGFWSNCHQLEAIIYRLEAIK